MTHFFLDRPVFSWVISILIMFAGVLSIAYLPVEQYPNIAPPTVTINAAYPGADAQTIENSVTQIIEQKLTGIDNLRYLNSKSLDGSSNITVTFEPGTNPDIAQVQTQNKIQLAIPQLPLSVQQQGVVVTKSNPNFLLVVGFYCDDNTLDQKDLGDIIVSKIQDSISRIPGVGSLTVFGNPHAMRIWLNPDKLLSYGLTTIDIKNAVQDQNIDISAGQLGGLPAVPGQQLNAPLIAQSMLKSPQEFENIILRVNSDGGQVRLKDVARIELGSDAYTRDVRYNRHPASGLAISLATGANALTTADAVKEKIAQLSDTLPPNIKIVYPFDTTPFIEISLKNILKTLFEAVFLVFIIMYIFLQNFRATLIPTIAVPVVLLGTFGVLAAFGFTINVLTLFAMVLAIGLLVDDAIVVVENVERIMKEEKKSAKEATRKSMDQITGALVGITLVLSSVFVPMAFFSGSAGAIYRQFSITLVSSMVLSVIVALILSPTLCATILKPQEEKKKGFFGWFNRNFANCREVYIQGSRNITKRIFRFIMIYIGILACIALIFIKLPTSFLPDEDQGIMYLLLNTPSGSTAERTLESTKKIEDYVLDKEKNNIEHLFTIVGFNFSGVAQNAGMGFLSLKKWDERKDENQSVFSIAKRTMYALMQLKDAMAFAIFPPPIRELGTASGFNFQLIDRAGLGHDTLIKARNQLFSLASANPKIVGIRTNGLEDVPQFKLHIDSEKVKAMSLSISDVNNTLQTAWGSSYINDFLDHERIKKVYIQADSIYRMSPDDIKKWYVRNKNNEMIPFSSFSQGSWKFGSPKLERFNGVSSIEIQGSAATGVSTGEAMQIIETISQELPKGIAIEWIGLSYEERLSGSQTKILYTLSLLFVFLCLAALYESWAVPLAVILTVPFGIFGAALFTWANNFQNDIYFQLALLTTVGLVAKNAILIIEFAKKQYESGMDITEAALMAAKLRFRPIAMTSMAFILGVMPLALSTGAGAAGQNAIGVGVIGGMVAATLAIFFVPMFYIIAQTLKKGSRA